MEQTILSPNGRVDEIKREISILEWDIPRIRGSRLRARKEMKLMECKKELEALQNKCS